MAVYVYARVSTVRTQSTDPQETAMRLRFPAAEVVTEVASGARERPALSVLVSRLVSGDQLVVAALDRLGRRTSEVLALIENLEKRGIVLISMREGIDYSTASGRLLTQILCSVAEMERSQCSSRTKMGLAHARSKGVRLGPPKGNVNRRGKRKLHSRVFIDRLLRLSRKLNQRELAHELQISTGTVCTLLRRYSGKSNDVTGR